MNLGNQLSRYATMALLVVSVDACQNKLSSKDIQVGMTYDEVEAVLGKPSAIDRGVNNLEVDVRQLSLADLHNVEPSVNPNLAENHQPSAVENAQRAIEDSLSTWSSTEVLRDPHQWLARNVLYTDGSLIYVSWAYRETKLDTFYVQQRQSTVTLYFVNEERVSEDQFDKVNDSVFHDPDGYIIDESTWQAYKKSGLYRMVEPTPATKRTANKFLALDGSLSDQAETVRTYYQVTQKLCIIFDASSGRVARVGFFPFEVIQI